MGPKEWSGPRADFERGQQDTPVEWMRRKKDRGRGRFV